MKTLKMILVMVFCFGFIQVAMAQEDWEIQSPLPNGIGWSVYDVHAFDRDNAIFSSSGILEYNNGMWKKINLNKHLYSLIFFDNKTGYSLERQNDIWKTYDGGKTWTTVHSRHSIMSMFFLNENLGWIVGQGWHERERMHFGLISRTNNGGKTWSDYYIEVSKLRLVYVYFADEDNGWTISKGGRIYRTKNSGRSWEEETFIVNNNPNIFRGGSFFFSDSLTGWYSGNGIPYSDFPILLRTIDGGTNWVIKSDVEFKSIHFINSYTGWAISAGKGIIYRTNDGGVSWKKQFEDESYSLHTICFGDPYSGWAVGGSGRGIGAILRTTDGGDNWIQQTKGTTVQLKSISMFDKDTGWISGNPVTLKTTDGGNTWNLAFLNYCEDFTNLRNPIHFTDYTNGWRITKGCGCVGCYVSIDKTTDGGISWNTKYGEGGRGGGGNINSLHAVDSLSLWAIGSGVEDDIWKPRVLSTIDGGESWDDIYFDEKLSFRSICFADLNHGYITGVDTNGIGAIMKTTDRGKNWAVQNIEPCTALNQIFWADTITGWAVGDSGVILKTDQNSEFDWTLKPSETIQNLNAIYMNSNKTGLVVGKNGTILRTDNGGDSWTLIDLDITQNLNAVQFVDDMTGWIAGDGGLIMKTTNGGVSFVEESTEYLVQSIPNYQLSQNYPNPFNPSSTIEFTLPKSEFVELKVYNILGKEVTTLVSNKLNPGSHTYQFDGKNLASGIYYYQLVAGDFREVKKMILLR